jgi:hypothetical protein
MIPKDLKALLILIISRLTGAVDVAQVGLHTTKCFNDDLTNIHKYFAYVMS